MLIALTGLLIAAAEGPFHDLSFEKACDKAKAEKKIVFIDFFTTWCGPCKMLDTTTWKDAKVKAWLTEKAVALKIDAEQQEKLAAQYKVDAYPTMVFLRPDGVEIDRIVGYRDPAGFLEEAAGAATGKDAIARLKEKLVGKDANDPMARQQMAGLLARKGRDHEALAEYLWCFDHGLEHSIAYTGVRVSFLLAEIARLGERHEPALAALKHRLKTAEKKLLGGATDPRCAQDFAALCRTLGAMDKVLAVFDQLKRQGKQAETARKQLFDMVLDKLLEAKRYREILDAVGDVAARIGQRIEQHNGTLKFFDGKSDIPKEQRQELVAMMADNLIRDGVKLFEAQLGAKEIDAAQITADSLLKFHGKPSAFELLIVAANRAGHEATAKKLSERAKTNAAVNDKPVGKD